MAKTGEHGITGTIFFNRRVIRRSNVKIKFLDVMYKSISAFIF
jgi:hypothetical protein